MAITTASIIVAVISAVVSIGTAAGLERSRRVSAKRIEDLRATQQRELEVLKNELAAKERMASKAEEARELFERYRDPLLRAAFDLQSRLYNVLRPGGFRGGGDREYFRLNTLFVIAEFFGWLEIIRRDMQFLDLGAEALTKRLNERIAKIQQCFAATSTFSNDPYFIYRGHQRAIGELMIEPIATTASRPGPRYQCLGYAAFAGKHDEPSFSKWFSRVGEEIEKLPDRRSRRLVSVQHRLIDLIDLLDSDKIRFATDRSRLS